MKIGCDACGRAEAAVLCCADEAALCRRCDGAVHSANKLARRHQRVALLPSSPAPDVGEGAGGHPVCDICQEKTGYFFCLEDRALLCRPCDVAVHAAGVHASAHRRFLITGVRVGDVQIHDHVPCKDGAVSPSSSSAHSGFPCSSGSDPVSISNDVMRPSPAAEEIHAEEGFCRERWPWSEIFADGSGGITCGSSCLTAPSLT